MISQNNGMSNTDIQSKIDWYRHNNRAIQSLIAAMSDDLQSDNSELDELDQQVTESFDAVLSHRPANGLESKILVEFLVAEIRGAVDDCSRIDPLLNLLALKATEKLVA
jgi:hypothetical protein